MGICACGSQRSKLSVFLNHSPAYLFEIRALAELGVELTDLATLVRELLSPSSRQGCVRLDLIAFYKDIANLNSGSPICEASTFSTEQSPQPKDKRFSRDK